MFLISLSGGQRRTAWGGTVPDPSPVPNSRYSGTELWPLVQELSRASVNRAEVARLFRVDHDLDTSPSAPAAHKLANLYIQVVEQGIVPRNPDRTGECAISALDGIFASLPARQKAIWERMRHRLSCAEPMLLAQIGRP